MRFFDALKRGWTILQRGLTFIGDIISTIILTVFYYSVFAVVAIPLRLIERPFAPASGTSNFRAAVRTFETREDLRQEF